MAFKRPTLAELIERISGDLASRIEGIAPLLRRAVARSMATTVSGAAHGLHGHLAWLADQLMPDTADIDHLERWASIWGLTRNSATPATGTVTANGSDGSVIPAGTLLQSAAGVEYGVDAEATISAGSAALTVTASTPGEAGNLAAGQAISFVSPIAGVNSSATVATGGLGGGAKIEDDDGLRARLLNRIQQPPQGGAAHDYAAWALEVSGVTRAWCYPLELGPGTVTVRIADDDGAGAPIPDAATVTACQEHIDTRRPVTADVTVVAPVAVELNLTIALAPNTVAVQEAVTAEIADLLLREAEPEGGSGEGTILVSHIREAISIAAGETDHDLVSPTADVTHTIGQMAKIGTITWA